MRFVLTSMTMLTKCDPYVSVCPVCHLCHLCHLCAPATPGVFLPVPDKSGLYM